MAAVRADAGNKNAASAYVMGAGGLAVDAMSIGCLGVERSGRRFFVLSTDSRGCSGRIPIHTRLFEKNQFHPVKSEAGSLVVKIKKRRNPLQAFQ